MSTEFLQSKKPKNPLQNYPETWYDNEKIEVLVDCCILLKRYLKVDSIGMIF